METMLDRMFYIYDIQTAAYWTQDCKEYETYRPDAGCFDLDFATKMCSTFNSKNGHAAPAILIQPAD